MTRLSTIVLLAVASMIVVYGVELPQTGDPSSNEAVLDHYGEGIMKVLTKQDLDDEDLVLYLHSLALLPADIPKSQQMNIIVKHHVTASFLARRLLNMGNADSFLDVSEFQNALETMQKRFDISVVAAFLCGFLQYEIGQLEGSPVDSLEGIHLQRYLQLATIAEEYCDPISAKDVLTENAHMFQVQQRSETRALISNNVSESDSDDEEPTTQSDQLLEYILQHPLEFLNSTDILLKLFRSGIHFKLGQVMKRVTESIFQARRDARKAQREGKAVETDYSLDVFKLILPYVVKMESGITSYLKQRLRNLNKPMIVELFNNPGFQYDFQFHKDYNYMIEAVNNEAEGGQQDQVEFFLALPGSEVWLTPAMVQSIRKTAKIRHFQNLGYFVDLMDEAANLPDLTEVEIAIGSQQKVACN